MARTICAALRQALIAATLGDGCTQTNPCQPRAADVDRLLTAIAG